MVATGSKPARVKLDDGTSVRFFCEESAELYFTGYGEARLAGGRAHIELDPVFMQTVTIDDCHPIKVSVQVEDDCAGVYMTNKTETGFDVVELQGGGRTSPSPAGLCANENITRMHGSRSRRNALPSRAA